MKIWPILIIKFAKVGSKCCQILTNPINIAKCVYFCQIWSPWFYYLPTWVRGNDIRTASLRLWSDHLLIGKGKVNLRLIFIWAHLGHSVLVKLGLFWPPFSLFFSFNTPDSKKYCRRMDSNRGSLLSEATALPTATPPLFCLLILCLKRDWNWRHCDQGTYMPTICWL